MRCQIDMASGGLSLSILVGYSPFLIPALIRFIAKLSGGFFSGKGWVQGPVGCRRAGARSNWTIHGEDYRIRPGRITQECQGGATIRDDGAGGDAMDAPNVGVRGVVLASSLSELWWRCIVFVTSPLPPSLPL